MSRCGLHEVYSPSIGTEVVANVVFVHGLFGDPFETWTRRISGDRVPSEAGASSTVTPGTTSKGDGNVFWPRDLLPDVIPNARILTFGYDADVYHFRAAVGQNTIHQHASNLLADIADLQGSSETLLPIIFVAYSLGGIIVKDALNQSSQTEGSRLKSIAPATYGICFLGTPHRGSKSASLGKIAYSATRAALQRPNTAVLQSLKKSSNTLNRIGDSFRQTMLKHDLKIYSFREEKETRKFLFFGSIAVDADSARIGDGKEEINSIPDDHGSMSKFAGKFDVGFKRVSSQLRRWIEDIRKSTAVEDMSDGYLECLASLDNADSRLRMSQVAASHEKTFHWLYDESLVPFSKWLQNGSDDMCPIFWLQGKPGAGKSTLMAFAMRDRRTMDLLNAFNECPWLLGKFFFHDRGSLAQKSLTAMLKEILRQILHHYAQLWRVVRPFYGSLSADQHTMSPDWDAETLQQALLDVAQQRLMEARICIFLDALDEHAGDNEQLASLLFKLTTNALDSMTKLKICVASRSWTVFAKHFRNCPGLAIHEYTRNDIRTYTEATLSQVPIWPMQQSTPSTSSKNTEVLAGQVTDRAQGVFIWVRLVVGELAQGIRDGTPLAELEDQLSKMPQELKDLYMNTVRRIEPEYQEETHIMLQIALCSFSPLPLATFLKCAFYCRQNKELKDCGTNDEMLRWLASRSGGLLEVVAGYLFNAETESTENLSLDGNSNVTHTSFEPVFIVQFIHQTVREFALEYGHDLQLRSKDLSDVSGHLQLLRYAARGCGALWDGTQRDIFKHASVIENEFPQEIDMMVSALRPYDIRDFIFNTKQVPASWVDEGLGYCLTAEQLPRLLRVAVAANLGLFLRQTIGMISAIPTGLGNIATIGLLHIAVCGPKIVEGQDDRLSMIRLLLELGIPSNGTIRGLALIPPPPDRDDTEGRDTRRWMALGLILSRMYAIDEKTRLSMAEVLLEYGAAPHTSVWYWDGLFSITAIQSCIRFEGADMIKLFLRYGAPLHIEVLDGLPLAVFRSDINVRKVIQEYVESLGSIEGEEPLKTVWGDQTINMCVASGTLGVICTGFAGTIGGHDGFFRPPRQLAQVFKKRQAQEWAS